VEEKKDSVTVPQSFLKVKFLAFGKESETSIGHVSCFYKMITQHQQPLCILLD